MLKGKKGIKRPMGVRKDCWQQKMSKKISEKIIWKISSHLTRRLVRWKMFLLRNLERIDNKLSNRQRKWLFYLTVLCSSVYLFHLLGTAIRKPSVSFVLPFAAGSRQVNSRLLERALNKKIPEVRSIGRFHGAKTDATDTMNAVTNYSPLKIKTNGTK